MDDAKYEVHIHGPAQGIIIGDYASADISSAAASTEAFSALHPRLIQASSSSAQPSLRPSQPSSHNHA